MSKVPRLVGERPNMEDPAQEIVTKHEKNVGQIIKTEFFSQNVITITFFQLKLEQLVLMTNLKPVLKNLLYLVF